MNSYSLSQKLEGSQLEVSDEHFLYSNFGLRTLVGRFYEYVPHFLQIPAKFGKKYNTDIPRGRKIK